MTNKIALLIPSTTRNIKHPTQFNINRLPFLKTFLPTFLKSINKNTKNFRYIIYFGYDTHDAIYDNPIKFHLFKEQVMKRLTGYSVEIVYVRFELPIISLVDLWNQLFKRAYLEGNDYFYQLGDDIRFGPERWSSRFVRQLKKQKDIGVVGPHDTRHRFGTLLTQTFVSRKHYQIFGYYFPSTFLNVCCDDWITKVYGKRMYCFKHIVIWNDMKVRYVIDKTARKRLKDEVKHGIHTIQQFLGAENGLV